MGYVDRARQFLQETRSPETWNYRCLRIPSQEKSGYVDLWMVGNRTDGVEGVHFRFEGTVEADPEEVPGQGAISTWGTHGSINDL